MELRKQIKGVAVQVPADVLWPEGYSPTTYYPLPTKMPDGRPAAKFYREMAILSPEQEAAALQESWQITSRGDTCGRCKGRGATRKDKNVGCSVCEGLGVVQKS